MVTEDGKMYEDEGLLKIEGLQEFSTKTIVRRDFTLSLMPSSNHQQVRQYKSQPDIKTNFNVSSYPDSQI